MSICYYCNQHLQLEGEGCDQLIRLAVGQLAQLSLLVDLLLPRPGDGISLLEDGQHHLQLRKSLSSSCAHVQRSSSILGVRESTLQQPGGGGELCVGDGGQHPHVEEEGDGQLSWLWMLVKQPQRGEGHIASS